MVIFSLLSLSKQPKGVPSKNDRPIAIWVWVKIRPPGIGPQILVFSSIYQGSILGAYF